MKKKKIRYAVVGLGNIAQDAVLPAFRHAGNSELAALVSGDHRKLRRLGRRYEVSNLFSYDQYEDCLRSGLIDAVYITLPNEQHREYTERAAHARIHVLCEKPMALSAADCRSMIDACRSSQVKLMIAYRLHFEPANLHAIDLVNSGRIGEPRLFQSIHSQAARADNIRTQPVSRGGGPTYDLGIYDINAARYIFQDEPISVQAKAVHSRKKQYRAIEESMSVTLRFPGDRIASILYSFGAAPTETYRVAGTKGDLVLDHAYHFLGEKQLRVSVHGKSQARVYREHDQFAPQLIYFSDCILRNRKVEPSGIEGLTDIEIIEAIYESARTGRVVPIHPEQKAQRPELRQVITRPPVREPGLFHAEKPDQEEAA